MRKNLIILLLAAPVALISFVFSACSSGGGKKTFCDTACVTDTIKFILEENRLQPHVYISAKDCMNDTITLSYKGMGVNRKFFLGKKLNKDFVRCYINDTSYAWILFNNCETGRGYCWKLPFGREGKLSKASSAINNLDPKFSVENSMVAFTDKGNLFVEDALTGKKAMMTFGKWLDLDPDDIHQILDSVNITHTRIWAKVLIDKEWKEMEKKITLE